MIRQKHQEKPSGHWVTFSVGYSHCELPRAAAPKAACAAVPGGDYNLLLLLSSILHLPLLPYSLTPGTLSRIYCRAVLPGKDEGSPQTAAEQSFLVVPTAFPLAVVPGSMGSRGSKFLPDCGTSAHKRATVTLEAKERGFKPPTNFHRETECQTYLGIVRGIWRMPVIMPGLPW